MRLISLIAAIDKNSGLGFDNSLPWHLPKDLQHFKKLTVGKPIIMGSNTFFSIGKILPNRLNIILTKQEKTLFFEQIKKILISNIINPHKLINSKIENNLPTIDRLDFTQWDKVIKIVNSLEEALHETSFASEIMIIGGESIFKQALPIANKIYLTRVHASFKVDRYFPNIDDTVWKCIAKELIKKDTKNPYDLSFYQYIKVHHHIK